MTSTWTVEMYTDARGHCPVERWLDSLPVAKFAAIDAAIHHLLERQGLDLAGGSWLKPLKQGLYELRVRSTAAEIVRMYSDAGHMPPRTPRASCFGSSWRSTATRSCCSWTATTRARTRARSGSNERSLQPASYSRTGRPSRLARRRTADAGGKRCGSGPECGG